MTTKLDAISQTIGALEEGQRNLRDGQDRSEVWRKDHANKTETKFAEINDKLDRLSDAIDGKVQKSIISYLHGTAGGGVALGIAYIAQKMGIKIP